MSLGSSSRSVRSALERCRIYSFSLALLLKVAFSLRLIGISPSTKHDGRSTLMSEGQPHSRIAANSFRLKYALARSSLLLSAASFKLAIVFESSSLFFFCLSMDDAKNREIKDI
jgi:hypothetical protein